MTSRTRLFGLAALAGLALAAPGRAAFTLGGTGPVGSYTGTMDVTPVNANAATLTITLTNTSPAGNGGYLTAFVFNNPGNLVTGSSMNMLLSDSGFDVFTPGNNNIGGTPYGQFDFLVSTSPSFEGGGPGGGQPSDGLGVGETGTFVINLTGSGVGGLTVPDFGAALSTEPGIGQAGPQYFVARFRGFEDDRSDKVAPSGPPSPVGEIAAPAPATAVLAVLGVVSSVGLRRVRRRAAV